MGSRKGGLPSPQLRGRWPTPTVRAVFGNPSSRSEARLGVQVVDLGGDRWDGSGEGKRTGDVSPSQDTTAVQSAVGHVVLCSWAAPRGRRKNRESSPPRSRRPEIRSLLAGFFSPAPKQNGSGGQRRLVVGGPAQARGERPGQRGAGPECFLHVPSLPRSLSCCSA